MSTRSTTAVPSKPSWLRCEGGIPLKAEMTLRSQMLLSVAQKTDRGYLLSVRFRDVAEAQLQAFDRDLFADLDLAAHEAFVELGRDGAIGRIQASPETPELFRDLVQGLFLQAQVVLDEQAEHWTRELAGVHGEGPVQFRTEGPNTLTRERESYERLVALPGADAAETTLDARARAVLDSTNYLASFTDHEQIRATAGQNTLSAEATLSLELVAQRTEAPRSVPGALQGRALADRSPSQDAGERLLRTRAGGLTMERLTALILAHPDGAIADRGRLAWQASALLRLHPELCTELAKLFADPGLGARARGFVMDLLVAAGSGPAQAALVDILNSDEALDDPAYSIYLQRLSLLKSPGPQTVEFLSDRYEVARLDEDTTVARSALLAMGAASHAAREHGQTELADEIDATLLDELAQSESPEETGARLRALGNAGDPKHADRISSYAGDDSADVRHGAARALYRIADDPTAHATLMTLAVDPAADVQGAALQALANTKLSDTEVRTLGEAVQGGQMRTEHDGMLVNVLAQHEGANEAKATLYAELRERHPGDPRFQARLRALEAEL